MLLNKDTKKAQVLKDNYFRALKAYENGDYKYKDVLNFYKSPSYNKVRAEMLIQYKMQDQDGYGYIITGGNCMTFSCGYLFKTLNGTVMLNYETAYNTYIIPIDD